jgi:uncharacterized protein
MERDRDKLSGIGVGPDAVVKNLFIRLITEWDGFTVNPGEFYDAGSAVIVEARYTGTFKETSYQGDLNRRTSERSCLASE